MESDFLKAAGEKYGDFVVTKHQPISELNCVLRELIHMPSGANVMHIANDDPENLFCLSFQTYPENSNGVPHILEHTVLCGSRKFPVKDPFFAMSRRSLNTFMNALTGSDFTCYPAASQVEKDYYNLLDVYIDAVFHPELKRLSFLQEGHRLEFATPSDPFTPLQIKGIVYNEMKGSLSSPETRLWHEMLAALVPDLPYAHNSGGDPKEIPNLTYPELIAFHENFYHPSRCLFFFYGNFPLKKHLDFIAEKALKNVLKAEPLPPLPRQKRFTAAVHKESRYPISAGEEGSHRTIVTFGWLTAPLVDQEEVLALCVLDAVLMETDASLLKRAFLESKLCVHADAYLDIEMNEVPYAIICKGCEKGSEEKLEKVLRSAIEKIIADGIPHHLLEAAIHQLEFSRTEITGDSSPFGLTIFMRSGLVKQHGCAPESALMIHSLFEALLEKVKDPEYLNNLLRKHLLDNPHFVRLIMHPDPQLSSEELKEEQIRVKKVQENLTPKEVAHIVEQAKELGIYQKRTEAQSLDCLPKVTLSDVNPMIRDFDLKHIQHSNLDVYHHDCFTNQILYADLVFDLPTIEDEDLPYVQLLLSLLPEIGSGNRSYQENLEFMQAYTGGIGATAALHVQVTDPKQAKPSINLRGKALYRNVDKLFTLMKDTLLSPRFDEKGRIEELVFQIRESLLNRLNRQAMRYAVHLAISGFSPAGYINDTWYGLKYFKTIEELSKNLSDNLPKLIDKLTVLRLKLFTLNKPHLVLSCSKEMLHELEKQNFYALADLPKSHSFTPWNIDFDLPSVDSQARPISAQVAFTVEAFKSVSYFHPHAPSLLVSTLILDNKILHPRIREQGGAYGCGATYSTSSGHFYFHSYRDPHVASTLDTFHHAIDEIAAGHFLEQDLEEAKLGIVQQFDTPVAPGSRALTAYTWLRDGKTATMRQQFRDRLLALTVKDIQHAVTTELLPKKADGVIVSFGGKELLERENLELAISHRSLPILPL